MNLRPVTYNWNSESDSDPKHTGFIAQDVQQIFPDLVSQDPNTHLLSLNYIGLVPYTIKALQEMNLQIKVIPIETDQSFTDRLALFLKNIAETGSAIVDRVRTHELCVDDICVTRDQFLQMVQQSSAPQPSVSSVPVSDQDTTLPDDDTSVDSGVSDDSTVTVPDTDTTESTSDTDDVSSVPDTVADTDTDTGSSDTVAAPADTDSPADDSSAATPTATDTAPAAPDDSGTAQ
jgi:hypothetical protein